MLSDTLKYWLCVVVIAIGIAWFTDRIGSAIIFLIASGAIFIYWTKSRRAKRENRD